MKSPELVFEKGEEVMLVVEYLGNDDVMTKTIVWGVIEREIDFKQKDCDDSRTRRVVLLQERVLVQGEYEGTTDNTGRRMWYIFHDEIRKCKQQDVERIAMGELL